MKREEEKDKIPVPVRRPQVIEVEEAGKKLSEETEGPKIWKTPRRWIVR